MGMACWMKAKAPVTWEHHHPEGTTALGTPRPWEHHPWEHHRPGSTTALSITPGSTTALGASPSWEQHHPGSTTVLGAPRPWEHHRPGGTMAL